MSHLDQFRGMPAIRFVPRAALRTRVSRLFETPFDRRTRDLAARVAELRAKSDRELAAIGLQRGDILHHVFGARACRQPQNRA